MKIFKTEISIKFRDADPAKIMFFGHVFDFAHDAFEGFIKDCGIGWQTWFNTKKWLIPIRHTEADFLAPLMPGKNYSIEACVESIGNSSFTMKYRFLGENSKEHATVKMVHTFLDSQTMEKISVPAEISEKLKPYLG